MINWLSVKLTENGDGGVEVKRFSEKLSNLIGRLPIDTPFKNSFQQKKPEFSFSVLKQLLEET